MSGMRIVAEFGDGTDLHGCDVTKAVRRAVKDVISRRCLHDLFELQDMKDPGRVLENILREVEYSGF